MPLALEKVGWFSRIFYIIVLCDTLIIKLAHMIRRKKYITCHKGRLKKPINKKKHKTYHKCFYNGKLICSSRYASLSCLLFVSFPDHVLS